MVRLYLYLYLYLLFTVCSLSLLAQENNLTQTVRGQITDRQTQEPIEFATVVLFNSEKQYVAITDKKGEFFLHNIPVGRYIRKPFFISTF